MWTRWNVADSWGHGGAAFTAWHRVLLARFEDELRLVDNSVRIPWWDWTVDRTATSPPWLNDFLGGDGGGDEPGRQRLGRSDNGALRHSAGNWNITTGDPGTNDDPWDRAYLARGFGAPQRRHVPAHKPWRRRRHSTRRSTATPLGARGAAAQPCPPLGQRPDDQPRLAIRPRVLAAPLQPRPAVGDLDARAPGRRPLYRARRRCEPPPADGHAQVLRRRGRPSHLRGRGRTAPSTPSRITRSSLVRGRSAGRDPRDAVRFVHRRRGRAHNLRRGRLRVEAVDSVSFEVLSAVPAPFGLPPSLHPPAPVLPGETAQVGRVGCRSRPPVPGWSRRSR